MTEDLGDTDRPQRLRLFPGEHVDTKSASVPDAIGESDEVPKGRGYTQLRRFDFDYYFVFPSYGKEFEDMSSWVSHWRNELRWEQRFWPGFCGGGVLAMPLRIPARQRVSIALKSGTCHHKPVHGLVLGNASGQELGKCVSCAIPDRPPMMAVKMGLAEAVPNPSVGATVEHAASAGAERFLLVVPKMNQRSVKLIDQVPAWLSAFGVNVADPPFAPPVGLREEMRDWFSDPQRTLLTFRLIGGEPNAAWQLAVIYYVAEYWATQTRGLQSLHFVSSIEGEPNFRKYWTSNK